MASILLAEKGGGQRTVPLEGERVIVGKREDCQIVLAKPNVSRQHCEILFRGGKHILRDMGSSNGTLVNGTKIEGPVYLVDGTEIEVGDYVLTYMDGSEPPAPAAPEPKPSATAKHEAPPTEAPKAAESARADGVKVIPSELKKKLHRALLIHREIRALDMTRSKDAETREKVERVTDELIVKFAADIPDWVDKAILKKEILDEALGLGPLEDLLADDAVSEIMVNAWNKIYIERKGHITLSEKQYTDNESVVNCIQRILSPIGRRIDESSPMVDGRLKDGSRVNAIIQPLAISGPTLTIRKFMKKRLGVDDLIKFGSMTKGMGDFLKICVESHKNMVISGGTGSGKTTLLNVLGSFIGPDERIVTVEDSAELKLPQDHVITLEAKPPNIEGQGAIPIRKLVINCLRMRPDRIVVGECRGGEAFDMLQAMNTGHDGSLTTLHANTPRDAIARLENMVLMAGMDLPQRAIREQIASAVHLIVQQSRLRDGSRRVTFITEVTGMESGIITLQDIFIFKQTGYNREGKIIGSYVATGVVPKFYDDLRERGIKLDMKIFSEGMAV